MNLLGKHKGRLSLDYQKFWWTPQKSIRQTVLASFFDAIGFIDASNSMHPVTVIKLYRRIEYRRCPVRVRSSNSGEFRGFWRNKIPRVVALVFRIGVVLGTMCTFYLIWAYSFCCCFCLTVQIVFIKWYVSSFCWFLCMNIVLFKILSCHGIFPGRFVHVFAYVSSSKFDVLVDLHFSLPSNKNWISSVKFPISFGVLSVVLNAWNSTKSSLKLQRLSLISNCSNKLYSAPSTSIFAIIAESGRIPSLLVDG